jgi:hypothetical protein
MILVKMDHVLYGNMLKDQPRKALESYNEMINKALESHGKLFEKDQFTYEELYSLWVELTMCTDELILKKDVKAKVDQASKHCLDMMRDIKGSMEDCD